MAPEKTSLSPTTGVWFTTVTPNVAGPSAGSVASNVRSGAFVGVSLGSSPTSALFCASKKRRGQLFTAGASVVVVTVLRVVVVGGGGLVVVGTPPCASATTKPGSAHDQMSPRSALVRRPI